MPNICYDKSLDNLSSLCYHLSFLSCEQKATRPVCNIVQVFNLVEDGVVAAGVVFLKDLLLVNIYTCARQQRQDLSREQAGVSSFISIISKESQR